MMGAAVGEDSDDFALGLVLKIVIARLVAGAMGSVRKMLPTCMRPYGHGHGRRTKALLCTQLDGLAALVGGAVV
jgi:hypothetical protein